jgi:osmotically inducible lipoprotein OsmB
MSTFTIKAIALSMALFAGGCAMNETGKRTGTGAAIGALGGAVLGGSRESAVIGAAVGATGGYIYDQQKKKETSTVDNEQLRQENERLRLEAENQQLRGQTGQ